MTARTYGSIALRCNPLFQGYSRRLLFLFFLRSLLRQWKALRRKAGAFVIAAWRKTIDLDHVAALRALIVLTPLVLLAMTSGDGIWLRAALVTISTFIAMERSGLAPLGTLLHGAGIIVCYLALLAAQAVEPLFVLGCALLSAASILLTGWNAGLRSLGNFTFIPALYLACETAKWRATGDPICRGIHFLPAMVLAILPVVALSAWEHRRTRPLNVSRVSHFRAVLSWTERNEPIPYLEALVATALAVALAAHAVMMWRLDHGQWMIWSAASVITGDLTSGRQKLRDRMVSALMGVPTGIGAGIFLPHSAFAYDLASLVALLSLVAVRPFVLAFGLRCASVSLALMLAGQSLGMAAERASQVILGGLIGLTVMYVVRVVAACPLVVRLSRPRCASRTRTESLIPRARASFDSSKPPCSSASAYSSSMRVRGIIET